MLSSSSRVLTSSLRRMPLIQARGIKRPPVNTTQLSEGRRCGALAMKVGMLPLYDKWGIRHEVTFAASDN